MATFVSHEKCGETKIELVQEIHKVEVTILGELSQIKSRLTILETRAGFWGAMGGLISGLIVAVVAAWVSRG